MKAICINGHPMVGDNVGWQGEQKNRAYCKVCHRQREFRRLRTIRGIPLDRPHRNAPASVRWYRFVDREGPTPVNRPELGSCWLWTGYRTPLGYGRFHRIGVSEAVLAHNFGYELIVGPIPEGLELDHLCRNPPCVNPKHLEPVTHLENMRRSPIVTALHEFCKRGHPLEGNRYYKPNGNSECATCKRERDHKRKLAARDNYSAGLGDW